MDKKQVKYLRHINSPLFTKYKESAVEDKNWDHYYIIKCSDRHKFK